MKFSSAVAFAVAAASTTSAAAVGRQVDPLENMPVGTETDCYDGGQEWHNKDEAKNVIDMWCDDKFPRSITTGNQIKSCFSTDDQHYMLRMAAHGHAYTPFYMTVDECKTYMKMVVDTCIRGGEVRGYLDNVWLPRYVPASSASCDSLKYL